MKLIRIGAAARLLGLDAAALRRRIRGDYAEVYGFRLRAYRMDVSADSERRFNEDEIRRALAHIARAR